MLGSNIEILQLLGLANLDGYGNALNNALRGNASANDLFGRDGNDRLLGHYGADRLYGEDGNDGLNGGQGADTLYGGDGNDGFFGGGGNDGIYGGNGNDKVHGDGGNDRISGGAGNDILTGGQFKGVFSLGNDTFVWTQTDVVGVGGAWAGYDHVTDFRAGDRLDLSGLDLAAGPASSRVHVTNTAAGTVISANFGGTAGFVDVVILDRVHGVTLTSLLHDHAIIL